MKSKFLTLDLFDGVKALLMAVITAILAYVYGVLENGGDLSHLDYKQIVTVAVTTALGYLIKQLNTDSKGQLFKKEKK